MAVGGPETDLALGRTPLDIEAAQMGAASPAMAIVGQNTPQVTTRQAPGIPQPGNFSLTVEPQAYSWNPSQADFGQKQVAQIGVDGFNVPVAQRGFPTGAIASRQDALAQRKAQIAAQEQKLMASTDPFKGISDPAPPYRVAGNKLVQSAWSKLIADEAEFYGGDTAEATKALYSTAEGRDKINRFARTMDAVMKENAGRFDNVMDMALRVKEGKTQIEPEEAQLLTQYLNGIDPYTGVPVQGADMEELVRVGRGVDDVMFKEQYADKFLKGFDEFLETSFEPGKVQRLPGNKFSILDTEVSKVDDFIDSHSDSLVESGIFPTKKKASEWLSKRIKPRMEVKRTIYSETFSPERKKAAEAKYDTSVAPSTGSWSYTTRNFIADQRVRGALDPKTQYEFVSPPMDMGPNKNLVPPGPIKLHDANSPQGELVMVTGFAKPAKGGDWLVLGEKVDAPSLDEFNQWRTKNGLDVVTSQEVEMNRRTGEEFSSWYSQFGKKKGQPYQQLLSKNKSQIETKFGSDDPYRIGGIAQLAESNGIAFDPQVFSSWSKEKQEEFVNRLKGK
jgi:hypothetical protein